MKKRVLIKERCGGVKKVRPHTKTGRSEI